MKNSQKFYEPFKCIKSIQILKSIRNIDGTIDMGFDGKIDKETVDNAISQFENAKEKGVQYFPSIISEPHFTAKEIDEILNWV